MLLNRLTKYKYKNIFSYLYHSSLFGAQSVKLKYNISQKDSSRGVGHYYTEADKKIISSAEIKFNKEPIPDDESEVANFSFKTLLYDESSDDVIAKLNSCEDGNELLDFIKMTRNNFKHQHYLQCIFIIKDFQRNSDNYVLMKDLLEEIINGLKHWIKEMNIMEQSCCYLYIRKMEVPNTNAVLQRLLLDALNKVRATTPTDPIALPALSRLAVGISTEDEFHLPSVCCSFIPHIMSHIEQCDNEEDLRLISICLINLQPLITIEILEIFKSKLSMLIEKGEIKEFTPRTVLKLLQLLNLSTWSLRNGRLIRDLLLQLHPNLSKLTITDLKVTCRIFGYHLEPAALIVPLSVIMNELIKSQHKPDVLAAYMPFLEPCQREAITDIFKNLLSSPENWLTPYVAGDYFHIIRALKISDTKICDTYWANVLNALDSSSEEETHLRFLKHCHRYMNFNNNLGGTYRFIPLERRLSHMAMQTIENDIAGRLPSQFARLAAFILAYGHTPFDWRKFPNVLLSKIISMSSQFSIIDCSFISRGVYIAMELRFRNNVPELLAMQLSTIDSVLTECIGRHLENKLLSIHDLNMIVRTLGYRKTLKNNSVYQEALHRYDYLDYKEITSRTIREMAFNFTVSGFTSPVAMEAMFAYIENHHEHIIGQTVEKVLTCAYNLGYMPQSESVLEYAALILKRDFKHMSGLSIVQGCLALCYYKSIPEDLVEMVFCVKFIQRIEEEIHMCYSKATYPERVLNLIMQLNRTVCLDYPELNVPWFQQNYLEAQLSKKLKSHNRFGDDVKNLLTAVLSDESYFSCNHITPYGYKIDFVIHFDNNRKPVPVPVETTILDRITKVAILLLRLDSFCENDFTALRGQEHLRRRHLEMLGYKVLHINEHDWNTRYMNSPDSKKNYLKCLLKM